MSVPPGEKLENIIDCVQSVDDKSYQNLKYYIEYFVENPELQKSDFIDWLEDADNTTPTCDSIQTALTCSEDNDFVCGKLNVMIGGLVRGKRNAQAAVGAVNVYIEHIGCTLNDNSGQQVTEICGASGGLIASGVALAAVVAAGSFWGYKQLTKTGDTGGSDDTKDSEDLTKSYEMM